MYGTGYSEELLGRALKGRRNRYVLSTKCGINWRTAEGRKEYERDGMTAYRNLSAAAVRQDLEDSLTRLRTDYVDLFYTHRQSERWPVEETMGELLKLKEEGKIRAIGISQSKPEHLKDYLRIGPVDAVQEVFSLLDQDFGSDYLPLCEQHGVLAHSFGSLCRGLLTGRIGMGYRPAPGSAQNSIWFRPELRADVLSMLDSFRPLTEAYSCSLANLATAWVLAQSPSEAPLVGVRRMESLMNSIESFELNLSSADLAFMNEAAGKVIQKAKQLKAGA